MPQIPKHWKHIQCKEMTRVVNSVYIHNNDHLRNIWQLHINNRLYFQWMHLPFLHWWDWWYIRQIDPRPLAVAIWQYSISDPIDVPITLYLCLSNYFFDNLQANIFVGCIKYPQVTKVGAAELLLKSIVILRRQFATINSQFPSSTCVTFFPSMFFHNLWHKVHHLFTFRQLTNSNSWRC